MGNADGGQAWGTIMLPRSERAASKLPLALLPPKKGLLPPAQPHSVALKDLRQKSSPAPHQLPFVWVQAAPTLLTLPPTGSKRSCRRTQKRLGQHHPHSP